MLNINFICHDYLLKKLKGDFFYDNLCKNWYKYNGKIWIKINDLEFEGIILKFLVEHEAIKNNIKICYLNKAISYLKILLSEDINQITNNNKLLPFNNGILNLSTYELLPYSNTYKFFNSYTIDYKPDAKMSIFFVAWLLQISQRNLLNLNIIRNYLYLLLSKNTEFKVALYLHGPRGGGKYTFVEILRFIISRNGYYSSYLSCMNNKINRFLLLNRDLLLFLDLDDFNKKYLKSLDLIINGEIIDAKRSHSFNFKPSCLVLFTSNFIFEECSIFNNIIYLPFNKPEKGVDCLFRENFYDNSVLTDSLPGFINWILDNPKENLELFKDIKLLNNKINSISNKNSLLDFNYFSKYLDIEDNHLILLNNLFK